MRSSARGMAGHAYVINDVVTLGGSSYVRWQHGVSAAVGGGRSWLRVVRWVRRRCHWGAGYARATGNTGAIGAQFTGLDRATGATGDRGFQGDTSRLAQDNARPGASQ